MCTHIFFLSFQWPWNFSVIPCAGRQGIREPEIWAAIREPCLLPILFLFGVVRIQLAQILRYLQTGDHQKYYNLVNLGKRLGQPPRITTINIGTADPETAATIARKTLVEVDDLRLIMVSAARLSVQPGTDSREHLLCAPPNNNSNTRCAHTNIFTPKSCNLRYCHICKNTSLNRTPPL